MSLAEKIYYDDEARKIKQEELILFMGSPIYKHICNKMLMRSRTLLDGLDVRDLLIKNDSVTMQLKEDCKNPACKAQILEPKLKKALQITKLKEGTSQLKGKPLCTFCGHEIDIPQIKIILGAYSRSFRHDRVPRHRFSKEYLLSGEQMMKKTHEYCLSKRGKYKTIDVMKFRHNNPALFWNIIFYLSNYGLPYDMFLPYQDTKEIERIEAQFERMNSHCIIHII